MCISNSGGSGSRIFQLAVKDVHYHHNNYTIAFLILYKSKFDLLM